MCCFLSLFPLQFWHILLVYISVDHLVLLLNVCIDFQCCILALLTRKYFISNNALQRLISAYYLLSIYAKPVYVFKIGT